MSMCEADPFGVDPGGQIDGEKQAHGGEEIPTASFEECFQVCDQWRAEQRARRDVELIGASDFFVESQVVRGYTLA